MESNDVHDGQHEFAVKDSIDKTLLLRIKELSQQLNEIISVRIENIMMRDRADYILRIESYMGLTIYELIREIE